MLINDNNGYTEVYSDDIPKIIFIKGVTIDK